MPNVRHPRRGSMQFWPRKRAKHSLARIRSWAEPHQVKPLGFIGYKAGMTQLLVDDKQPKSMTKGETIVLPATIIDCPPMLVMGVSFYKNSLKVNQILAQQLNQHLDLKIQLPKKNTRKIEDIKDFDDLRLLVNSQPEFTTIGTKKPKMIEIALGGSTEEKLNYAKNILGKELKVGEVFNGELAVDVHSITKGKGFQGTVKRFGVPIRQHKAEKTKRGIATLGPWTPKYIRFTVAQAGKMGYHLRTEYNKQILKIGEKGDDVNPAGGLTKYGLVRNSYVLLKGSIPGSRKRAVVLTQVIRPNKKILKDAFDVVSISK